MFPQVTRIVLLWVNNHFNDFEGDPAMTRFLEEFEKNLEDTVRLKITYLFIEFRDSAPISPSQGQQFRTGFILSYVLNVCSENSNPLFSFSAHPLPLQPK